MDNGDERWSSFLISARGSFNKHHMTYRSRDLHWPFIPTTNGTGKRPIGNSSTKLIGESLIRSKGSQMLSAMERH
jgi:hypothetical protein